MNIAETLRGLLRRWYILIPGLLLAVAAAGYLWIETPPTYQRSGSQLLLPAEATLPEVEIKVEGGEPGETETLAPNPFLYLGGLNTAADVLVSAVRGAPAVASAAERYPGSEIEVGRDPMSSGPMLLVTVTAATDDDAASLLATMLDETARVLDEIQTTQNVPDRSRIAISPIAVDLESTLGTKDRMMLAGGAGVGILLFAVLLAAAVDGLVRSRGRRAARRRARASGKSRRDRASGRGGLETSEPGPLRESVEELAVDDDVPAEVPGNVVHLPLTDRDPERAERASDEASETEDDEHDPDLPDPGTAPVGARARRR